MALIWGRPRRLAVTTLAAMLALNCAVAYAESGSSSEAGGTSTSLAPTRFVIGLEKAADFEIQTLSNPNRVIVDLPEMKLQLPPATGGKPVGLVSDFRAGQSAPGRSRVIIDVTGPVVVKSKTIQNGTAGTSPHLAIELLPAAAADAKTVKKAAFKIAPSGLGASGIQPPSPREALRPSVLAARSFKPVIVIDPGHGGHDSGATKNGTIEKDVVLAFSKVLAKKLEETGRYRVVMTRDTDVFIPLGERLEIAEKANATLFMAVHADYAQNKARGATIFSLRDSQAKALEGSAKREVADRALSTAEAERIKKTGGAEDDVDTVKSILGDLAQREVDTTKERTNLFTRAVVEFMGETTNLRDEPEQQAGFRVLKTAKFPSVLIELAYVTNKEDAAQLNSDAWRQKVADSIRSAIDTYYSQQVARLPM